MSLHSDNISGEIDKDVLLNVPVMLTVEVGRTRMTLAELLGPAPDTSS